MKFFPASVWENKVVLRNNTVRYYLSVFIDEQAGSSGKRFGVTEKNAEGSVYRQG